MLRDGFLRFCDDPDIACCRAEAELGKLRIENGQLYAELAELQELAQARAEGRLVVLPCNVDKGKMEQILKLCSDDG